jgi:hypothetical protein
LPELDTLFALAELAVGMAGFSAIVVLFKRRESGRWLPRDADRFNGMVLHAMAGAAFCFLPAFVDVLTGQESTLWRVCSALLGAQIAIHAAIVVRLPSTSMRARALVAGGALVAVTLQVLSVADLWIPNGFTPYLIGLQWHLLQAGVLFVLLIWVRDDDIEGGA